LYDEKRIRTSAMLELGWCAGERARAFLKEHIAEPALLFVCVTDPKGREQRYLFDLLHGVQGLIEFHCSGEHKIFGKILYDRKLKSAQENYLKKHSRYEYDLTLNEIKNLKSELGNTEIELEVAAGDFFAKEPSPWVEWYVNLWYSEPWWDKCILERRMLWAIPKTPLVLAFIAFAATVRSVIAFWFGFMLAERGIKWSAIVHPFIYGWRNVRSDQEKFQENWGSALYFHSEGSSRGFFGGVLWCAMPVLHVILFMIAAIYVAFDKYQKVVPTPRVFLTDVFWHYLMALGAIAGLALGIGFIVLVVMLAIDAGGWTSKNFNKRYPTGTAERKLFYVRAQWAALAGFIAFAFYMNSGGRHVIVDTLTSPWLVVLIMYLVNIVMWAAIVVVMSWGYGYLPNSYRRTIRLTLRDGFVAFGNEFEDGARYLEKRREEREKEARERDRKAAALIYEQLACEQAPATGQGMRQITSLRSVPVVTRARLVIEAHQLNNCRPRARG
jgi:hypothetical protein